jgi:putative membrane protein
MIKYNPKSWMGLIFHRYSRETFKKTLPNMIVLAFYATLYTVVYELYFRDWFEVSTVVHSLLGIVLGLFLVFRTNTAYDKWWEGRIIWGSMVNDCRNLSIKLSAFLKADDSSHRTEFAYFIRNYVFAMKQHLRGEPMDVSVKLNEADHEKIEKWNHKPNYLASELYKKANELYTTNEISGEQLFLLDKELKGLTDNIGACERIKNTPIPYAYNMYMKKFIFIYSVTLPLGFVSTFHYWTVAVTLFIFYFLITVELIAEEIEEPFGMDENDLPLDELSANISANVQEILGVDITQSR